SLALAAGATARAPAFAAESRLARGLEVGIVLSPLTERTRPGALSRQRETVEEARAAGASVRLLGDGDLARTERLAGLDVIVLPYVAAMNLRQRQVLAGWVRAGGGLVGLYFAGRDDERGRPLVGQGVGRNYLGRSRYGGRTEWADLSPIFSAEFLNDVRQKRARVALLPGHPLTQQAAIAYGGRLPQLTIERETGVWTELAIPRGNARPLLVYRSVERPRDPRARPGSVIGWTSVAGRGRAVYVGFDLMDYWEAYASTAYYEPDVAARNARAGTAFFRAALRWAAGPRAVTLAAARS
ncbi:MAG: hypothetical protein QOK40_796, partial [Miltoncostaeaceae bacterium]|nr:hypothetical protein [Miltoncostaeaceae bacterium]